MRIVTLGAYNIANADFDTTNLTDDKTSTQVEKAEFLKFDLTNILLQDSISFFNIVGKSIDITQKDSNSNTIKTEALTLLTTSTYSIWDYLYEEVGYITELTYDILPNANSLTIQINNQNSTAKLGFVAIGTSKILGLTKAEWSDGITDYSVKNIDDFGNATIVERDYSKKGEFVIYVANKNSTRIKNILTKERSRKCIFIINQDNIIYGFLKDWSRLYNTDDYIAFNITLEGLI